INRGISGVVRKCTEKVTGKKYAVKIVDLIGQKENDREVLEESTLREISILRMLANHPHIIELHDAFVGKTHILLVLELLVSKELFDILTEVVTFSETRTRVIMKQLLEAVEFIHSKTIAHRDIKAENILVDDNNNIKLSDFGFASTLKHDNEFTDLCGTFEYLSPELLKSQLYDNYQGYGRSVDMWACGTLMYTLLQGSSPFWAPERAQILKNILAAKYSFSNPRWNDYSYNAKDLVIRLLTVDPEVRLTAKEALKHPFFGLTQYQALSDVIMIILVSFLLLLLLLFLCAMLLCFLRLIPHAIIPVYQVSTDPYSVRSFRRLIDSGAFKIYGHWVNRDPTQSRDLLFENNRKMTARQYVVVCWCCLLVGVVCWCCLCCGCVGVVVACCCCGCLCVLVLLLLLFLMLIWMMWHDMWMKLINLQ
ncbi:hypothetical protein HELRODRAFT_82909, partial [Helobdella robusta]|uniref:phosphorylase kinase n=1 Tax=Helobdella robusta TaxID=6412 RepID=T1G4Y0_HELRO